MTQRLAGGYLSPPGRVRSAAVGFGVAVAAIGVSPAGSAQAASFYAPMTPRALDAADRLAISRPAAPLARPAPLQRICGWREAARAPERAAREALGCAADDSRGAAGGAVYVAGRGASGARLPQPNRRGRTTGSRAELGVAWRRHLGRWAAVSLEVGAIGRAGDSQLDLSGTYLSLGGGYAQLDLGFRPHWFGGGAGGPLLLSNNAATPPSITLSNPRAMGGPLRLDYTLFLASLAHQDGITTRDDPTEGRPRLLGFHVSSEPVPGLSLGASRLMQYGGGQRSSFYKSVVKAFFFPRKQDNNPRPGTGAQVDFGDQQAALHAAVAFPARPRMRVYASLAGEDTSHSKPYRFGNAAWLGGVFLPDIGPGLRLRYEVAEWQSSWYVHPFYSAGNSNGRAVYGHWYGDRRPGEPGRGHSLSVGFPAGGYDTQLRFRHYGSLAGDATGWGLAVDVVRPGARRWRLGGSLGRTRGGSRFVGLELGIRWGLP